MKGSFTVDPKFDFSECQARRNSCVLGQGMNEVWKQLCPRPLCPNKEVHGCSIQPTLMLIPKLTWLHTVDADVGKPSICLLLAP